MKTKLIVLMLAASFAIAALWIGIQSQPTTPEKNLTETASIVPEPDRPSPAPASVSAIDATTASEPVQQFVSLETSYQERVAAMERITSDLAEADQEVLRNFLLTRNAADENQIGHVHKNQLLDALCALDPPPSWLGQTLIQMYHDHNQHVVIRDYAVQHMVALYEQLELTSANHSDIKRSLESVLWNALKEIDNSIAGTALLGLNRLAEAYPEKFEPKEISRAALQMAGNSAAGELARITSFQICARLNVAEALPMIWQAAQSGNSIPTRISAIHALGNLGTRNNESFLQTILSGEEERLKPSAQAALNRILEREQSAAGYNPSQS